MYKLQIDAQREGRMVKNLLRSELKISSRLLKQLVQQNQITSNGRPVYVTSRVQQGDIINVTLPKESPNVRPERMKLDIQYEDEEVIVVNKPPGMLTHPSARERDGSLLAGIQAHLMESELVPHCVHRLDRDTSGLVMFAKHAHAHHLYDLALRAGQLHRSYCALVFDPTAPAIKPGASSPLSSESGNEGRTWQTIDLPIGLDPDAYSKRKISENGKEAVTHYCIMERRGVVSVAQIALETGRTHQIRLHFAAIGTPLVGDTHYTVLHSRTAPSESEAVQLRINNTSFRIRRQALHAYRLTWRHPVGSQIREAVCDPPADIKSVWRDIGGTDDVWIELQEDRSALQVLKMV